MECSGGCCSTFKPRYKRLVNNIYPASPSERYDKSNLEKLTFYARAQSEKLDRIGNYLAQRIARDLMRHRFGHVVIGVEAMDRLLITKNAQSLNLFVESFLRVVQQLIESQELDMQLLGTQSFVKFASIEEDTASYHRRYDFFVSKFASMAHNNDPDMEKRRQLRLAGLNGLRGVIRKTASDDLRAKIWDDIQKNKIDPSLLYMQSQDLEAHYHEKQHRHRQSQDSTTPPRSENNSVCADLDNDSSSSSSSSSSSPDKKQSDEKDEKVSKKTNFSVTFETFKKKLTDESPTEPEEEKRTRIVNWFKTATFDELVERAMSTKCTAGDYYTLSLNIAAKCIC